MVDKVEALPVKSFEYGGTIRTPARGAFLIDRRTAKQLEDMGQLRIVQQKPDPTPAAGAQQSASPAAPASPQTTSSGSVSGGRRGRRQKQDESS